MNAFRHLPLVVLVACSGSSAGAGPSMDATPEPEAASLVDATVLDASDDRVDSATADGSLDAAIDAGSFPKPPGLALWLEASSGVTQTNGNFVSQWEDQSGAGNHASQATSARRPAWLANGINGRPALRFSAAGNQLVVADSASLRFGTGDFTLELVARFSNPPSEPCFLAAKVDPLGAGIVFIGNEPIDESKGLGVFLDGANFLGGTPSYGDGVARLYGVRRVNGTLEIRVQGKAVSTLPGATVDVSALGADLVFGLYNDDGALHGDIAEVFAIHGAISKAQVFAVESHLMSKYGL